MIESGNPVIGINTNPNTNPPTQDITSPDLGLPNGATRILWSGLLDNSNQNYNFLDANGSDGNSNVNCNNSISNPECASYESGSTIYTFDQFLTINFQETSAAASNLCTIKSQAIPADNAFSGMLDVSYAWIVPSYPFLMILTGSLSSCSYGSGNTTNLCNGLGFSAISPTPGFNSNINFWSSSVSHYGNSGLIFDAGIGVLRNVDPLEPRFHLGVRCASAAW